MLMKKAYTFFTLFNAMFARLYVEDLIRQLGDPKKKIKNTTPHPVLSSNPYTFKDFSEYFSYIFMFSMFCA